MGRTKKTLGQIKHTIRRASERYNMALSENDVKHIVNIIRATSKECAERNYLREYVHTITTRLSVWKIFYKETWLIVVYDKTRHNVATILPPDWTPDRSGGDESAVE